MTPRRRNKGGRNGKRTPPRPLDREMETYRRERPRLLPDEGKFVRINGDDVLGLFKTRESALKEGYRRFGHGVPFLAREIRAVEPPVFMHHDPAIFRVRPRPAAGD